MKLPLTALSLYRLAFIFLHPAFSLIVGAESIEENNNAEEEALEEALINDIDKLLSLELTENEIAYDSWLKSGSLFSGIGYTDNTFRGPEKLASEYIQIGGDYFLSFIRDSPWAIDAYAYVYWRNYEAPELLDDEWIFLSELKASYEFLDKTLSIKIDNFYGDQLFGGDELDRRGIPSGERVIFLQPTLSTTLEYFPKENHVLTATLFASRVELNLEEYNEWEFGAKFAWDYSFQFFFPIQSSLSLAYKNNNFDTLPKRNRFGVEYGDDGNLIEDNFEIELSTRIYLVETPEIYLELVGIMEWADDNGRGYEDLTEKEARITLASEWEKTELRISARQSKTHFSNRTLSQIDLSLYQTQRSSLSLTHDYQITENIEITTELDWEEFKSNSPSENYRVSSVFIYFTYFY